MGIWNRKNKNIKTWIQFSQADLIQAHKTDSYLFPSDPNKISFLGLVFVGSICTVLETDSTVTTCGRKQNTWKNNITMQHLSKYTCIFNCSKWATVPSSSFTFPDMPRPGIAITVDFRDCSLGLILSIFRIRLLLFWALDCRLLWSWSRCKMHNKSPLHRFHLPWK